MIRKHTISNLQRRECRKRKDREDKLVRDLAAESRRLSYARLNAELVPLEKPYQRGWVRFFKLSERATRRPDADKLEELLRYVNNYEHCRKRLFLGWSREKGKRVPIPHRLSRISVNQIFWEKLPEYLFPYFIYCGGGKKLEKRYLYFLRERRQNQCFEVKSQYLFRSVTTPYIVTHQRKEIPEVRRREDEIDAWMEANNGWNRYENLKGRRVWNWEDERERVRKRDAKQEMRLALLEHNDRCRMAGRDFEFAEGTMRIVPFDFQMPTLSTAA